MATPSRKKLLGEITRIIGPYLALQDAGLRRVERLIKLAEEIGVTAELSLPDLDAMSTSQDVLRARSIDSRAPRRVLKNDGKRSASGK